MHDDLANHLRSWGLKVVEHPGWQHNGRPWSDHFNPEAIVIHHTASAAGSGNFPSRNVVVNGRGVELPGPLCHLLIGRDGVIELITGGGANHAGTGGPLIGIPRDQANYYAWGFECENNGTGERWPAVQLQVMYRASAAMMEYSNIKSVSKVIGHKEWTSRKIDPAGINMNTFRQNVAAATKHGPSLVKVNLSSLKPGKSNGQIVRLKRRLHKRGFFKNPKLSPYFGSDLRKAVSAYQKSKGWHGPDADGIPGRQTLQSLGFFVVD